MSRKTDKIPTTGSVQPTRDAGAAVSRRNMLLGGATLATATAAAGASILTVQYTGPAQAQAPTGRKPNILMIVGIGLSAVRPRSGDSDG